MIGFMVPSVHAEQVPSWVKSTAGWWATDQIEESEFLKAIEYLIKHQIIQISEAAIIPTVTDELAGSIRIEEIETKYDDYIFTSGESKTRWNLPERANTLDLKISGSVISAGKGIGSLRAEIISPSGVNTGIYQKEIGIIDGGGVFSGIYSLTSKSETGKYKINVKYDETKYEMGYFLVIGNDTSVPSWIKNNAKWWADGNISDQNFLDGIEFLIENGIIKRSEEIKSITVGAFDDITGTLPIEEFSNIWDDYKIEGEYDNRFSLLFFKDPIIYGLYGYTDRSLGYSEEDMSIKQTTVLNNPEIKCHFSEIDPNFVELNYQIEIVSVFHYECRMANVEVISSAWISTSDSENRIEIQKQSVYVTLEKILQKNGYNKNISNLEGIKKSSENEITNIDPKIITSDEGFSSLSCTQNDYGSVVMTGRYTNGPIPYDSIFFTLGIEDSNGNIVATGIGSLSNVGAYQTRIFEASAGWEYDFANCIIEVRSVYE